MTEKNCEYRRTAEELLEFIGKSPTCFHAVRNMKEVLNTEGYQELLESESWELKEGGKYYVARNESSLIAFRIPGRNFKGYQIMASHSDSPTFKIKENPEMEAEKHYTKLNVEKYGGMLCAPWFDRPLSIAGRILVNEGGEIATRLVNVDRDLVMIPNLAIHMNREVNDGYKYNPQTDMLPVLGDETANGSLMTIIADAAAVSEEDILGHDLFLYNRVKGTFWGAGEEYISSGRLDDLECAFSSFRGFLTAEDGESVPVHCVLDNEEVGSGTKQGAASTFLKDTLMRINRSLGRSEEQYYMALASSFMLSADNAHGVHPNHGDKADPVNRPYLNGGIVLKYNANQKYTTDGVATAVFKTLCREIDVPCQVFTNRSDIAGGSTLGNIANNQTAMNTVDIGLAQLAMHSPYETGGVKDVFYLVKVAREFFGLSIVQQGAGRFCIKR
ncbi:M18 family aminopeptidase [Lactonifactor longoviformis]|uniref:M18 family aminopeptidase n=1 Tax=Lactonifactor longoviformis TaxID=341220 RepID=UPI0036F1BBB4